MTDDKLIDQGASQRTEAQVCKTRRIFAAEHIRHRVRPVRAERHHRPCIAFDVEAPAMRVIHQDGDLQMHRIGVEPGVGTRDDEQMQHHHGEQQGDPAALGCRIRVGRRCGQRPQATHRIGDIAPCKCQRHQQQCCVDGRVMDLHCGSDADEADPYADADQCRDRPWQGRTRITRHTYPSDQARA